MNDNIKLSNGKIVSWDEFSKWSARKQKLNIIPHPLTGRKIDEHEKTTRKKLREEKIANGELVYHRGDQHFNSQRLITPMGEFACAKTAAITHNFSLTYIRKLINDPSNLDYYYCDDSFKIKRTQPTRLTGKNNKNSRPINTPLGKFESLSEALVAHGVTTSTLLKLIKNPELTEYFYADTNTKESRSFKDRKERCRTNAKRVSTPLGIFDSVKAACDAMKMNPCAFYDRLKSDKFPEFKYV